MFSRLLILALLVAPNASAHAQVHGAPPAPSTTVRRATAEENAKGRALFKEKIRAMLVDHGLERHGGRKTRGDFDCRHREAFVTRAHKGIPIVPFSALDALQRGPTYLAWHNKQLRLTLEYRAAKPPPPS